MTAITDPYKYIPTGYSAGIMPADFGTKLSSKQIAALVAYLIKATEAKKKCARRSRRAARSRSEQRAQREHDAHDHDDHRRSP